MSKQIGAMFGYLKATAHPKPVDEWVCPYCGKKITANIDDYAEVGTPYCPDCSCDMVLA